MCKMSNPVISQNRDRPKLKLSHLRLGSGRRSCADLPPLSLLQDLVGRLVDVLHLLLAGLAWNESSAFVNWVFSGFIFSILLYGIWMLFIVYMLLFKCAMMKEQSIYLKTKLKLRDLWFRWTLMVERGFWLFVKYHFVSPRSYKRYMLPINKWV